MAKLERKSLVDFVATMGRLWREDSYILLTQWGRVAFMWIPLSIGGSAPVCQVLERAEWLTPEQARREVQATISMEELRRNRTAGWDLVGENGCVEVTFHGKEIALLVAVPSGDAGWEPANVVLVLSGEALMEEVENDNDVV